jgi:prepilin-type N-terminal cleavage/methylation domain-containing protein/prepilin-type processing-associated H-X9-DG protein
MKYQRVGFTLIELLIVIAIIAILASVLYPVFAQAREKARLSACISNSKQLGLALSQYSTDYDETLPYGNNFGSGWTANIYPYVKSTQVYACPSDSTYGLAPSGYYTISYAFNEGIFIINTPTVIPPVITNMNAPAKTVLLYEVVNSVANPTNPNEKDDCEGAGSFIPYGIKGAVPGIYRETSGHPCVPDTGLMGGAFTNITQSSIHTTGTWGAYTGYSLQPLGRHQNGANYIFCDGHTKWLMPDLVSPGGSAYSQNDAQFLHTYGWGGGTPSAAGTGVSTFAATFSKI